ncbi:hypothetical protein ACEPPN_000180 [Leptodophora sp. 'Broadleaf-Isolate-01']
MSKSSADIQTTSGPASSSGAVRFLRIISFNLKFWNTKAVTTYGSRTNIVRMVVPYSSSFLKPRPGTFYYIYTLNSWTFWENHPFTLAYSTPELSDSSPSNSPSSSLSLGTISPPRRAASPIHANFNLTTASTPTSAIHIPESAALLTHSQETTTPSSSLTFIIRPYNGFTSRLRISAIHRPATQRVLIEGPYGETQPFHRYENVLFVVGGTGIAVPLSYLSVLLNGEARTRRVGVVWAVREVEFLEEVLGKDFSGRGGEGNVEAEVEVRLTAYITRRGGEDKDDEGEGMGVGVGQEISMGMGRRVKVLRGRPNVFDEVENAALEAGDESLAVVACGPDGHQSGNFDMLGANKTARARNAEMQQNWIDKITYFDRSNNRSGVEELVSGYQNNQSCRVVHRFQGAFNYCFKLRFDEDGQEWILRFPIEGDIMDPVRKVLREATVMRFVREKTTIPVPKVIASATIAAQL